MRVLHILSPQSGESVLHRVQAIAAMGEGEHWMAKPADEAMVTTGALRPLPEFPTLSGMPGLGRLQRLAKAMIGFDLVCTYGYGAMNAVMARTAFSRAYALPPIVHHESEWTKKSVGPDLYRRIALEGTAALVVCDGVIAGRAQLDWQQPTSRIHVIPDGLDLAQWHKPPPGNLHPNLLKRPGEYWVGAFCRFSGDESLESLVEAFAAETEEWHLVLFGDGPCRGAVRAQAERLEIAHRVHTPGRVDEQGKVVGLFDIALLFPGQREEVMQALRAMASGRTIIADQSSRAAAMLQKPASDFAVSFADSARFGAALTKLASDDRLRRTIGEANRQTAQQRHDLKHMQAAYRRLFARFVRP